MITSCNKHKHTRHTYNMSSEFCYMHHPNIILHVYTRHQFVLNLFVRRCFSVCLMLWFRSYELKAVLVPEAVANNTIPLTIYCTYTQHARHSSDIASPSCLILCLTCYELKTENINNCNLF